MARLSVSNIQRKQRVVSAVFERTKYALNESKKSFSDLSNFVQDTGRDLSKLPKIDAKDFNNFKQNTGGGGGGAGLLGLAGNALQFPGATKKAGQALKKGVKGGKSFVKKLFSRGGKKGAKTGTKKAASVAGRKIAGEAVEQGSKKAAKKVIQKGAQKAGAMAAKKGAGKFLAKKVPILGLVLGTGFAIEKAMKGDLLGAAMEMGSGVASTIPGAGTAVSAALDTATIARDINKANEEEGEIPQDEEQQEDTQTEESKVEGQKSDDGEGLDEPVEDKKGIDSKVEPQDDILDVKRFEDVVNKFGGGEEFVYSRTEIKTKKSVNQTTGEMTKEKTREKTTGAIQLEDLYANQDQILSQLPEGTTIESIVDGTSGIDPQVLFPILKSSDAQAASSAKERARTMQRLQDNNLINPDNTVKGHSSFDETYIDQTLTTNETVEKKPEGAMRWLAGAADVATGGIFDFDKRGSMVDGIKNIFNKKDDKEDKQKVDPQTKMMARIGEQTSSNVNMIKDSTALSTEPKEIEEKPVPSAQEDSADAESVTKADVKSELEATSEQLQPPEEKKPEGIMRGIAGFGDFLTGNIFDFDQRNEEVETPKMDVEVVKTELAPKEVATVIEQYTLNNNPQSQMVNSQGPPQVIMVTRDGGAGGSLPSPVVVQSGGASMSIPQASDRDMAIALTKQMLLTKLGT